jgi:hypothetical protein
VSGVISHRSDKDEEDEEGGRRLCGAVQGALNRDRDFGEKRHASLRILIGGGFWAPIVTHTCSHT